MICFKCRQELKPGQRYRVTKRGRYHRNCKNPSAGALDINLLWLQYSNQVHIVGEGYKHIMRKTDFRNVIKKLKEILKR